jgi:HK97 gp10 family phage protein
MADNLKATFDTSGFTAALDRLAGPARTHLARSMAVAGGQVLRDEAKALAPVKDGILRNAIYLAFREARSNDKQVQYSVTWNSKKAPHGHLIEFGHWQPFKIAVLPDGRIYTLKARLPSPKWVPAHPFLRPALTGGTARAMAAMIARGRERLAELLAGSTEEKEAADA